MAFDAGSSKLRRIGWAACLFLAGVGTTFLYSHIVRLLAITRGGSHELSYSDFLTVTLTALCALLAALAIFIGGAAIWGYTGIKEALTEQVKAKADEALHEKLNEYPAASAVIEILERMKELHEQQKLLSNQLVTESSSKPVARASKRREDSAKANPTLAKRYPQKGNDDGSSSI